MNSKPLAIAILLSMFLPDSANAQSAAGKTIMARGDVSANNAEQQRKLRRRAPVFIVDNVVTGNDSATQLRMIDGGLLSMQADSELAIARYEFDQNSNAGNVEMSLLKGGLRTITGALESTPESYTLSTPIASIGVRGTHYEAELFEGDLYLAGWEGTIVIQVDKSSNTFSLGPNERYRFAIVRANGDVEFLVNAPAQFTEGHSNIIIAGSSENTEDEESVALSTSNVAQVNNEPPSSLSADVLGETFIDNDQLTARLLPEEEGVVRSGSAVFNRLTNVDFSSSNGPITDINMAITVNFDTASIPTGNLSFNDAQGEWFAAFNGLINSNSLDLNINFAAYDNRLASGSIDGLFIDNATSILGNVSLFEIANPESNAGGSFILTEETP